MFSSIIRESFLNYFHNRKHLKLPGSPLIPEDASLLFTIAGMVQFKSYFLDLALPPATRITTCQPCLRVNDINLIGISPRHVTLLEMLGNFSIGDYFKEEAIAYAWEFITEYLKLPEDKLVVTVYQQDEETIQLWKKVAGIPENKIILLGDEDNFWRMGETGPCGPCSEVYYDKGDGSITVNDFPGDRFLEFWNLVFIQYNAHEDGKLTPLPKKSIDTGMGLERIAAIMQKQDSVFETDLFTPIIKVLSQALNLEYRGDKVIPLRIIADHLRSITFLFSEGLTPANEWRGYVLRRLIRRSFLKGYRLGSQKPFLSGIIPEIVTNMKSFYPHLKDKLDWVIEGVKSEEEKFLKTLGRGLDYFHEHLTRVKENKISIFSGKDAFFLYDTYGFPLELQTELLAEENLSLDMEAFKEEMNKQKNFSKFHSKEELEKIEVSQFEKFPATEFVGYTTLEVETTTLVCQKNDDNSYYCLFDSTPFYGFGGGELSDKGTVISPRGTGKVIEVKATNSGRIVHTIEIDGSFIHEGDRVILKVDENRRKDMESHHTCTHLLQSALRKLLGLQVKQAGSSVTPDYFRFDFTYHESLSPETIQEIELLVNEYIRGDYPVDYFMRSYQEAVDLGAMALFGEKYSDLVRVVKVGDISLELCGGTHLKSTGEAGLCLILKEEGIGAGLRRIEAICGRKALEYVNNLRKEKETALNLLNHSGSLVQGINIQLNEYKLLKEQKEILARQLSMSYKNQLLANSISHSQLNIASAIVEHLDQKTIRSLADELKNQLKDYVIILISKETGYLFITLSVKAMEKGLDAGKIANEIATASNGKGGGTREVGQGGIKEVDKVEQILANLPGMIERYLS